MDAILEKSFDRSRALLFGLLQACLLESEAKFNDILAQHEKFFQKRVPASFKDYLHMDHFGSLSAISLTSCSLYYSPASSFRSG